MWNVLLIEQYGLNAVGWTADTKLLVCQAGGGCRRGLHSCSADEKGG